MEKVLNRQGNDADVYVFGNGIVVFSSVVQRGGRAAKFNTKLTLRGNDKVDFAVGGGNDGSYGDTMYVDATIRADKKK